MVYCVEDLKAPSLHAWHLGYAVSAMFNRSTVNITMSCRITLGDAGSVTTHGY